MRYGPLLAFIVLAAVGAAGWYWLKDPPAVPQAGAGPGQGGGGGRRGAQRNAVVPVTVEVVRQETVPVYREGIGNVQALFAVTVRSQIDGRLSSVEFVEGQMIKKGDVLARIDPVIYKAQYDQAVAKRAQDQATLANARLDLTRYENLAKSNAGPKQQADQQAALVAQLEAQVKSDDAAIANAGAFLDYTVIASPLEGRAGLRQIDPGNIIHSSDANGLVSITQVMPIATVFTLPQRDLPVISAALATGKVAVEILESGGKGVLARGALQTMDNQIDVSTGTIKLKATFPNIDQKLWPGQFVSARVVVDTLTNAKVVSTAAIRRGPSGTFVFIVDSEDRAAVRPVNVLVQDETRAVIGGGVEIGDRVVTVGFAQLADGTTVVIAGEPAPPGTNAAARPKGERKRDGVRDPARQPKNGEVGAIEPGERKRGERPKEAVQ